MRLNKLTYLILEMNAAVDTGKYQSITLAEIEEHIDRKDLIPYLRERLGNDVDLSLYDDDVAAEINEELHDILLAYGGRERRKWGIENSGLCLLIAWVNELIQQRRWQD